MMKMMNRTMILSLLNYIRIMCDNESAICIKMYVIDILKDVIHTLERFQSLLKIDGINSKTMVLNDIQAILNDIESIRKDLNI